MDRSISISTAADFLRVGNALSGFCLDPECRHTATVDLTRLRPATVLTGPDRAPLRCNACGGKNVQRIVSPLGANGYWRREQPSQ